MTPKKRETQDNYRISHYPTYIDHWDYEDTRFNTDIRKCLNLFVSSDFNSGVSLVILSNFVKKIYFLVPADSGTTRHWYFRTRPRDSEEIPSRRFVPGIIVDEVVQ